MEIEFTTLHSELCMFMRPRQVYEDIKINFSFPNKAVGGVILLTQLNVFDFCFCSLSVKCLCTNLF